MFRVLRPGGVACHTIDIVAIDTIAEQYRDGLVGAGFRFVEPPEVLDWDVGKRSAQILLETLETAVTCYYAPWVASGQPIFDYHFGSVRVAVTKPL